MEKIHFSWGVIDKKKILIVKTEKKNERQGFKKTFYSLGHSSLHKRIFL